MNTDSTKAGIIHNDISSSAASDPSCVCLSKDEKTCRALPGQAIVMTKWTGIYGSFRIAGERYDELRSRLPAFIMENIAALKQFINVEKDIKIAHEHGDTCIHVCGEGGLYAALWDMARESDVGFTADFKDIPIRQETVEICEFYDINPYKLRSDGALIVVTSSPAELIEKYTDAGIPSAVIGHITKDKEKIIMYGDEKKHIQKPARDELNKILW